MRTAWQKLNMPVAPSPWPLSLTGAGALVVNVSCALMLVRFRHDGGSLTKTAFLWHSGWPDLIVGLGIAAMNADAAHEVWEAARKERQAAA